MIYSQSDLDWLGATDEADENVPDRVEDIKPRNFGKSSHGHEHQSTDSPSNGAAANGATDDDEDDESDYYDSDDEDDPSSEWNLRKCSAAALDVMALNFGDDLLQILLPTLRDKLFSVDWLEKESGILALGAIAEGEYATC
jgi:transportin-1